MHEEYTAAIIDRLFKCDDISTLDLILQILAKKCQET